MFRIVIYSFKTSATKERIISNAFNIIANSYGCKTFAIFKCIFSNTFNTVAND